MQHPTYSIMDIESQNDFNLSVEEQQRIISDAIKLHVVLFITSIITYMITNI